MNFFQSWGFVLLDLSSFCVKLWTEISKTTLISLVSFLTPQSLAFSTACGNLTEKNFKQKAIILDKDSQFSKTIWAMNTLNIFSLLATVAICSCKHLQCKLVICPTCRLQLNETVEQSQRFILQAQGPSDGTCEQGEKWIYFGEDFGLDNNACCCMPVPTYPISQCNPSSPDIKMCPMTPPFYKDDTIGEFYTRIGHELENSAPTDGCCPDGTMKFIFVPAVTGSFADICTCFVENMRVAEKPCSSSSSSSERGDS